MNVTQLSTLPWGGITAAVLIHFVWQAAVIGALVAVIHVLLGTRRAEHRYFVSLVGLVLMFLAPIVTASFYALNPNMLPAAAVNVPLADHSVWAVATPSGAADRPETATGVLAGVFEGAFLWMDQRRSVWIGIWLVGAGLMSARLMVGWLACRRFRRTGQAMPAAIERISIRLRAQMQTPARCAVMVSRHIRQAVAFGVVRPVVLVPASWITRMPIEAIEAVLAHELAHIRRWDVLITWFQRLAETMFFFHPAVWWLSHRLHQDREVCCDRLAISITGNQLTYAQTLSQVAEAMLGETNQTVQFGTPFFGGKKMSLLRRVRLVLEPDSPRARTSGKSGVAVFCSVCAVAALFWSQSFASPVAAVSAAESPRHDDNEKQRETQDTEAVDIEAVDIIVELLHQDADQAHDKGPHELIDAIIDLQLIDQADADALHEDSHEGQYETRDALLLRHLHDDVLALVELQDPDDTEAEHVQGVIELLLTDDPGSERLQQVAVAHLLRQHAQDGEVDRYELARQLREIADKLSGEQDLHFDVHMDDDQETLAIPHRHREKKPVDNRWHERHHTDALHEDHGQADEARREYYHLVVPQDNGKNRWEYSQITPHGIWLSQIPRRHRARLVEDPDARDSHERSQDNNWHSMIEDLKKEIEDLRRQVEELKDDGDHPQAYHLRQWNERTGDASPSNVELQWHPSPKRRKIKRDDGSGVWLEWRADYGAWIVDPKATDEETAAEHHPDNVEFRWELKTPEEKPSFRWKLNRPAREKDDRVPDDHAGVSDSWQNVVFDIQTADEADTTISDK